MILNTRQRCRATWLSKGKGCENFRVDNEDFCQYHVDKRYQDHEEYHLQDQWKDFRKSKGLTLDHRPILIDNVIYCQDSGMTDEETRGYLAIVEAEMRTTYEKRYGFYRNGGHDWWMDELKDLYDPYFHKPHGRIVRRTREETKNILEKRWAKFATPTQIEQDEENVVDESWVMGPRTALDDEWDQVEPQEKDEPSAEEKEIEDE